jgi:hypothetical protein
VRKQAAIQSRQQAQFGALLLPDHATAADAALHEQHKGRILKSIQDRQLQLDALKAQRKQTPKHVLLKDLPEVDRFTQLHADKKHLVDTIKMISYRAETMLVLLAKEKLARADEDARAWVRGLLASTVDLRPDLQEKTLTIRLHRQATAAQDVALHHVCAELNATETVYPRTDLRLIFQPVGGPIGVSKIPAGQDV